MNWLPLRIEHTALFLSDGDWNLISKVHIVTEVIRVGKFTSILDTADRIKRGKLTMTLVILDSSVQRGMEANSCFWSPSTLLLKFLSFNSPCNIKHPQTLLLCSLPWFKELQWIYFTVKSKASEKLFSTVLTTHIILKN